MEIQLDRIIPNPEQPRKDFDPVELQALADSIRQHGVINPIAVEEAGEHYILIDGERRVRAARIAGLTTIEASVRPAMNGTGHEQRLTLALVANIQRRDMNPVEEGRAFAELRALGYTVEQIGHMVGLTVTNVYTRLRILELEPEIQDLFAAHRLQLHSQVIAAVQSLPDDNRVRIARSLAQKKATMHSVISICKRAADPNNYHQTAPQPLQRRGEQWNMVKQAGDGLYLNPYRDAALATCMACPLYDTASPSSCRDCPGVDLLRRIASRQSVSTETAVRNG